MKTRLDSLVQLKSGSDSHWRQLAFPSSATFMSHFQVWTLALKTPIMRVSLHKDSRGTSGFD